MSIQKRFKNDYALKDYLYHMDHMRQLSKILSNE